MHPELQLLEQRYLELVAAVQAGHMSEADALATMAQVTAVDGEGALWSIDPYSGQFVRALPGTPPQPANPSLFAPAQLPPPPSDFAANPSMSAWGTPPSLQAAPADAPARKAAASAGAAASGLAATVSRHKRTLILALVVVAAVVIMFMARSGGGDTPVEPLPEATPSASVAPTASPTAAPTTEPSPTATAEAANVPSKKQAKQITAMLASGSQSVIAPLLATSPDQPAYLMSIAAISGANSLGFRVSPGDVKATDTGAVLYVNIAVGDQVPEAVYAVPLEAHGKGWVMAGPAELSK